jgi:hypothetical protein
MRPDDSPDLAEVQHLRSASSAASFGLCTSLCIYRPTAPAASARRSVSSLQGHRLNEMGGAGQADWLPAGI